MAVQAYQLVFGNTSTGIFKNNPATLFLDVSQVAELQGVTVGSSSITVGAAVSISNLINVLTANAGMSASFTVLAEHLSIVANVAVRNAGCWAGNLMLTHNNADFPSDIFTIMAATNATLTIASSSGSQTYDLFSFLQLDMSNCVIVSMSIPVVAAPSVLMTFKIMPRHINAHAYVNAGLLMAVDSNQNGLDCEVCVACILIVALRCSDWDTAICVWRDWAVRDACAEDSADVCWAESEQHFDAVECDGDVAARACAGPAAGSSECGVPTVACMLAAVQVLSVVSA